MKIDKQYLKFPKTLPNDLEDFLVFYPRKFPPIVAYYEEVADMIASDPKKFREYGNWAHDELFEGFEKIKKDYENGNQNSLEFLVDVDQRLNKLLCYRFWIVNYLFADGPLHNFFVDNIRSLIHKFAEVGENVEDFEQKVAMIQRDLFQGNYADLYLEQALSGNRLMKLLMDNKAIKSEMGLLLKSIDNDPKKNYDIINENWEKVLKKIMKTADDRILSELRVPLEQVEMRKTKIPLYNMLTHSMEFRLENSQLAERFGMMNARIAELKKLAKSKLSKKEFELFELCYEQIGNFTRYKDVMGEIDGYILPLWFGLHDKIRSLLNKKGVKIPDDPTGPASMFYFYVWYLPDDLKAKAMTVDRVPFDLGIL